MSKSSLDDIFNNAPEVEQKTPATELIEDKKEEIALKASEKEVEKKEDVEVKQEPEEGQKEPEEKYTLDKAQAELASMKKALNDSKSWGHKKNKTLINVKKKFTEYLNKLEEEGNIFQEQKEEAFSFFDLIEDDQSEPESNESKQPVAVNPLREVKDKIDKEFTVFKKYSKVEDADAKYNAFFALLPLSSQEEQTEFLNYMQEEAPEVVLDHIMTVSEDLYDNLYKGAEQHQGIVPYFKHIKNENNTLKKKTEEQAKEIKELKSQLAPTTEKVYNRSISSRVVNISPQKYANSLDIYNG